MEFRGQAVMITGGAGNLGHAAADAFAAAGARRIILDLDHGALEALYGQDREDLLLLTVDVTDAASVSRTVQEAVQRFGGVDVLCNIAGGFRMGKPVHETTAELWRSMMALNAESIINAASAVVPAMLKAGRGKIVNVAATAGMAGRAHMGAYSASKSAVIRLTEAMSAELREQGINVNCVLPSILDTPQNRADMPKANPARWVALEALTDVILFLASERARAIHGSALAVTGLS